MRRLLKLQRLQSYLDIIESVCDLLDIEVQSGEGGDWLVTEPGPGQHGLDFVSEHQVLSPDLGVLFQLRPPAASQVQRVLEHLRGALVLGAKLLLFAATQGRPDAVPRLLDLLHQLLDALLVAEEHLGTRWTCKG